MARLGELLVAAGLLTTDQVDQALRAQVMWGARIGTSLIELGVIDLDTLSAALGEQHGMPVALARHFERVDRELQRMLSPDLAQKFTCVPLLRVGADKNVVIAATGPLPLKALAIIADELAVDPSKLILSVAAELRVRYQLERVYGIQRGSRFMRTPGANRQSFHEIKVEQLEDSEPDISLDQLERAPTTQYSPAEEPEEAEELDELEELEAEPADDLAIDVDMGEHEEPLEPTMERDPTQARAMLASLDELRAETEEDFGDGSVMTDPEASPGKERRRYVRTISDEPAEAPAPPPPPPPSPPPPVRRKYSGTQDPPTTKGALGRIALKKVVTGTARDEAGGGNTLGEATRAIRRAATRDKVGALVIDALFRFMPSCHAATVLVVRGDVATSWKGFCRSGLAEADVAVPLEKPCLVAKSVHRNTTARAHTADLNAIDKALVIELAAQGELLVVPISIVGQVLGALALVVEPEANSLTPESIAAAAGAGFARLMRDASR